MGSQHWGGKWTKGPSRWDPSTEGESGNRVPLQLRSNLLLTPAGKWKISFLQWSLTGSIVYTSPFVPPTHHTAGHLRLFIYFQSLLLSHWSTNHWNFLGLWECLRSTLEVLNLSSVKLYLKCSIVLLYHNKYIFLSFILRFIIFYFPIL